MLVLALAAEGGRGFPVAKRATADANLAGGLLEEDARTRRLDKSRRGRLAAFWLASGPADAATIDSQPGWFPASTRLGKARYLRSFWPGFAVILFAIRTRMGRQFTRTAACRPHNFAAEGRTWQEGSIFAAAEAKPHPTIARGAGR